MGQVAAIRRILCGYVLILGIAVLTSCGDDGTSPQDTSRPSAVEDLSTNAATATTVELTWTAPGDDGQDGRASRYDIRYSTMPINEHAVWIAADTVAGAPIPDNAGTPERLTVTDLDHETHYYFALKAADEVSNWSKISNVAEATTLPDTTPPSPITDLTAGSATSWTVSLTWTEPGDDGDTGTAAFYDVRFSINPIDESNWASADETVVDPPTGPAGSTTGCTITHLSPGTTYYFAVKTVDEAENWSELSNTASATTLESGVQ
jgi:hypothetical protein